MRLMDAGRTLELALAKAEGHITMRELRQIVLLDLLVDGHVAEGFAPLIRGEWDDNE